MPRTATKKRVKVGPADLMKVAENLYVPNDFGKNHAYFADVEGTKAYYGVTTVLKVINKPAIVPWAAGCVVDHIKANATKLELKAEREYEDDYLSVSEELLDEAKVAHRIKKETAGEAGTDAHEMIEVLVKDAIEKSDGFIVANETGTNKQVDAFIKWAKENNICFLESEKRLYSEKHWYAGTCDLVFYDRDGVKWIGDVKTGSAIYPEYYFQMAAYQNALNEMGEHLDIKGAMVINTKKHGGIEIGMNYDYAGNLNAFLAALTIHKQLQALNPKHD